MIPNYQDRQIESSGISDMASFGISQDDSAHIMNILRDTLYSDKVLAVLREYSANAWDAHNMVGKGDVPIKVVLPTHLEPTLVIEDYGPGLSHEDVFQVYTQYGASTKRASNVAVGQLGIGSKSGFAYSDSFTVISRNGGKKRTYVAILDASEKGVINLLDEQPCGKDTGVTIQIPIKTEDITEFVTKAEALFKFFNPRPTINIYLPPEIPLQAKLKTGLIYDPERGNSGGTWLAVMGCIPYRLNLDQVNVTNDTTDKTGVGYWVHKLSGILYFNIGEVHISASREELKYSKTTKQTIIRRFSELVDEFVTSTIAAIKTDSISSWDKRLRAQILTKFDLPVPEEGKDLTRSYIDIQDTPEVIAKTFKFLSRDDGHPLQRFYINRRTRIVLGDDDRKLAGFNLGHEDMMLFKNDPNCPWETITEELDEYLKTNKLDGVTVVKLSSQTWYPPFVKTKPRRAVNPKYLRRSFVFVPNVKSHYHDPYSKYWEPTAAERVATDDDVFVLITGFKTEVACGFNLFETYRQDAEIAAFFGLKLPEIYGYKTSDLKPLAVADCAGTYYPLWRKKFIAGLVNGKAKAYLETYDWQQRYESRWEYRHVRLDMRELGNKVGRDHLIYDYLKKITKANKLWNKYSGTRQTVIHRLGQDRDKPVPDNSEPKLVSTMINSRYPLLSLSQEGLASLWTKHSVHWLEYIQLIDKAASMNLMTLTPAPESESEQDDD